MQSLRISRRFPNFIASSCKQRSAPSWQSRALATSSIHGAEEPSSQGGSLGSLASEIDSIPSASRSIVGVLEQHSKAKPRRRGSSSLGTGLNSPSNSSTQEADDILDEILRPAQALRHHLHIMATKHNTHITLTDGERNPVFSKSTGNIGFRKAARGTYDAAYQLAAYTLGQLYENVELFQKIKRLEVILRGFGVGREAVTKVLLGVEGRRIRPKIVQVTDATRLKFGGTRSRKPRRLG